MKVLRTPDDRFGDLPDFSYEPLYTEVPDGDGGTLRIHHIDEGPVEGPIVLCMHGQPTWSFLYRHMVPILTDAGLRVVAPDLVGFGRSDKPAAREDFSYNGQVAWMNAWLIANDLRGVTFVGQDWGGLIGLRLVAENPERFDRVVISNTGIPPVAMIIAGTMRDAPLSPRELAAYDAPFPDASYKMGPRAMPSLVPTLPDDPAIPEQAAAWKVLSEWRKPFLCAFTDDDPVTHGADVPFREKVPGAAGQPHTTIEGGGHFVQETRADQFSRVIMEAIHRSNP